MSDAMAQLADFHLLRPFWLLALLFLPVIYRWAKNYTAQSSSWAQAIDHHLLGYLLEQQDQKRNTKSSRLPFYLLMISLLLAALALAGPVWEKIPQPVHKKEDALVILLDLSLSMLANDIQPSRLIKAQHKLIDILDQRQQGQTALVVYAGDAHIVAPLTDDTGTIKAMAPALSPLLMPALGSRPELGLELAQQLLKDGGINEGRILLITDGIRSADADSLADSLQHRLSVLLVGTAEGGPIPVPEQGFLKQGQQIVIAKTELAPLQQLARKSGARLAQLRLDDSDINYLLQDEPFNLNAASRQVEREFDQWQEMGPWLLLLLAPLAALLFRRGWLLSLGFVLLLDPSQALAFGWADLWQTRDQQAAQALSQGDAAQAAELFESTPWKASAAYQAGDYQTAAAEFAKQDDAEGHYNRGNALAKAGQLKQAIAAYAQALQQAPQHEDARFNKKLVEQLMQKQQEQEQQQNQEQNNGQNAQGDQANQQNQAGNDSQKGEQNAQQPPSDQSQQGAEQNAGQQNPDQRETESEQQSNAQNQADSAQQKEQSGGTDKQEQPPPDQARQSAEETPPEVGKSEAASAMTPTDGHSEEQRQATEQWLRRIPEDPGGLLRRKFNYQYQQRQLENQFQPPQEDQPIW